MKKKYWYDYQPTEEEQQDGFVDHYGTEDRAEAIQFLREEYASGNTSAQVAIVDVEDSYVLDVITVDDVT